MMMVPTYPEDDSRALKVYQHQHHGCAGRPLGACPQSWDTIISRLRRPSVLHFPGFSRDFDCFDSENQWDGIVVFVGF